MKNLCLILLALFLWGCPTYDPPLGSVEILNYTDSAVYVYTTCSDTFPGEEPGLTLFLNTKSDNKDACGQRMRDTIAPNYRVNAYSWGSLYVGGTSNDPMVKCDNKKLAFYFIKEETMRAQTWKSICDKKLYEKRIALTQEELEKLCWRIIYE